MTDQQTAATDNALVEKLVAFVPAYRCMFHDELADNLEQAAERIKSLQAEADKLRVQLAQTIMRQDEEWQEAKADRQRLQAEVERLTAERDIAASWARGERTQAKADRQRMREAIQEALLRCSMSNNMRAELRAALNPASKEANE